MELRERNYRSKLGSRRSTKARREADPEESNRPLTDREKFSITRNHERNQVDYTHQIKKWAPLVILAAVIWYLVQNFVL
jgi:hypothetical protein